jgi:hypothetical protein
MFAHGYSGLAGADYKRVDLLGRHTRIPVRLAGVALLRRRPEDGLKQQQARGNYDFMRR